MAAKWETRYHESGHALVAHVMAMLHSCGMILNSDTDAYTSVIEDSDGSEAWCIKRAAVKLSGPLGRILQRGQPLEWDTMRNEGEYHTDFEEAVKIFRTHLGQGEHFGLDERVDELMNQACAMAHKVITPNRRIIEILADETEGRDRFSRDEIVATIGDKLS